MGKAKPEAIVKVTRNKYQQDKGPAGCSNVVTIYFEKPSPADDTATAKLFRLNAPPNQNPSGDYTFCRAPHYRAKDVIH